jgi:hypothetical protein
MNYGTIRKILESQFKDRMDVFRYENSKNLDGTTAINVSLVPVLKAVPCKMSFRETKREDASDIQIDENPITYQPKVFCAHDVGLKAGDFITIQIIDETGKVVATYTGNLGMPSIFLTHQEVVFSIDRSA